MDFLTIYEVGKSELHKLAGFEEAYLADIVPHFKIYLIANRCLSEVEDEWEYLVLKVDEEALTAVAVRKINGYGVEGKEIANIDETKMIVLKNKFSIDYS